MMQFVKLVPAYIRNIRNDKLIGSPTIWILSEPYNRTQTVYCMVSCKHSTVCDVGWREEMIPIILVLSCPITVMQNITKYPWNDYDRSILKQTEKRCGEIYKDAPCVKLFKKWDKQDYSVVCGKEK